MRDKLMHNKLLGSTALWTAAARAVESGRENHLFEDPWAAMLAGPDGAVWAANRLPDSLTPIILRVRFFDDFLQRIVQESTISQIVLPAAGLDTRAFRLKWPPGTNFFEMDQPGILQEKDQLLGTVGAQPACNRHTIEVDLTNPWKESLIKEGFDPGQPSVWLLEGFLFYIPNESISQILWQVHECSAPGSWMGFDIINNITLISPYTRHWIKMQAESGAPWIGTMDDPVGFLSVLGWKTTLSQAGAPDANHGRWQLPVIPVNLPDMPHNWFVTAQKEMR
jgi:methyltransferase (TIGR00027 family)